MNEAIDIVRGAAEAGRTITMAHGWAPRARDQKNII
jgi:hypothetical protein